mgnify:CR=1 FL=1
MKKSFLYVAFLVAVGCSAASQDLGNSDPNQSPTDPNGPADSGPPKVEAGSTDNGKPDSGPSSSGDASFTDEDGSVDPGGDASAEEPIVPNAKRVFATSVAFNGDLKTAGAASTGVEGADSLCAGAALAGSLGGTWKAWISAPGQNAADRIADVSPWYLVDRKTKVFEKKIGLAQGSLIPQAPGVNVGPFVDVRMNEFGAINPPKTGVASGFTCNSRTNAQPIGGYEGLVGIGISVDITWWTDSVTNPCDSTARLMCFEQ